MYLSRIAINKQRRESCRALSNPQIMHAAVLSSFPPGGGAPAEHARTLWRVDNLKSQMWLYVLSESRPDFNHIVDQFGWPSCDQPWETKDYRPLLSKLLKGQTWHFRLQANPIKSVEGKRLPHVTVEQQKQWLRSRTERNGFSILQSESGDGADHEAFDVVHRDTLVFKKRPEDKARVTLATATFEGMLKVEDPSVLANTLCMGIGKAKAYGCGLLTLAKP